MKKYLKILVSICLVICVLSNSLLVVGADKKKPSASKQIHINSAQEFVDFSEKCRLDSFSKKLVVHLDKDIDLSKSKFDGIPIFFGTFEGHNHTIKGLNIKAEGSAQGIFRYIKESAVVKDLNIEGKIISEGKCESVGAVAGYNEGKITNCIFNGEVGGGSYVGGLVGVNGLTGIIENSSITGNIYANHFVGGIVGENKGVVRNCINYAGVNITEKQNIVDISDITLNGITDSENAKTVTDIGGISGSNSGVIKKCKNYAAVGYLHMGYNVGGIVGSGIGYLTQCENYAKINGRKEVGGIVGQMEPSSQIKYSQDAVQTLQKQLNSIYYNSHNISNSASGNNAYVKEQFIVLGGKAKDAIIALQKLIPETEDGLKDPDRQQAALNVLSSSANSMMQTMGDIHSSSKNSAITSSTSFKTIVNQIDNMASTLCNPSDKLGGSFSDVSDKDTKKDLTGKVENSFNYGEISGDLNTGGIVGAIAWENDLDPEDDWNITGEMSMNFESEVRAVVLNCENYSEISAKKRNAGGIAGYTAFGLIKNCSNTGKVNAQTAEYVGGIVGESSGYLRSNSCKCELSGKAYVGGIAGSAVAVTDCRSMTYIDNAKEKVGSVLGIKGRTFPGREEEIKNNYYLVAKKDFGGIDGISYSGVAQPLDSKRFFALPKLKDIFAKSKITFVTDTGVYKILYVSTGRSLDRDDIPSVPEEHGKVGEWENIKKANLRCVYFDLTFRAVYASNTTTVQSKLLRSNSKPVLMAQSEFSNMENFSLEKVDDFPKIGKRQKVIECFKIPHFSDSQIQLRYSLPDGCEADSVQIFVRDNSGKWHEEKFTVNNSYLVFKADSSSDAFCLVSEVKILNEIYYIGWAIAVLVVIELAIVAVIVMKKKGIGIFKK